MFDVLFILMLHWGVADAALSTGVSNLGVVSYFVIWLQRHGEHQTMAVPLFLNPGIQLRATVPATVPVPVPGQQQAHAAP